MDKFYKSLFLKEHKLRMATLLPDFAAVKVPPGHPLKEVFAGALLYASTVTATQAVWLWWMLGSGVERTFHVYLGWSPSPNVLPHDGGHDRRIYDLQAPSLQVTAASIHLQQILGESAVGGFSIASPWDQLLTVKLTAPQREHRAVMQKAQTEALALSEGQRQAAVCSSLDEVFLSLRRELPAFISKLATAEH